MYAVISEKRSNIHDRSLVYVVKIISNIDDIKKDYDIQATDFKDEDSAGIYMNNYMYSNIKLYTKYLNLSGMHYPTSMVNSRYIIVYIGNDMTINPGLYAVSLHDFHKLIKVYSSIRIATNDEVDSTDINILDAPILVKTSELDKVDTLAPLEPDFYPEGATDLDIKNIQQGLDKYLPFIFNYYSILLNSDAIARKSYIMAQFPNMTDIEVNQFNDFLSNIFTHAQDLKDQGFSAEEIEKEILGQLLPNQGNN